MKEIQRMNNVEKGRLLAELFLDEIENITKDICNRYIFLQENKAEIHSQWDEENGMISFQMWCNLADNVFNALQKEGKRILKPKCFADQLFDGYLAIFTVDCIVKYAEKERKETKFYHLVLSLFNL